MNEIMKYSTHCKRLYGEEEWIDWLLSSSDDDASREMEQHLRLCPKCRGIVEKWTPLLQSADHSQELRETERMPSPNVYRKLRHHVRTRSVMLAIRRRGKWFAAAAAALLLLVGVLAVYHSTEESTSDQRSIYVAQYEPHAVPFMNDPKTTSYRIFPYNEALGEGYVWFNGSSQEMLVLLEGLFPSEGHVVQAWAVDDKGRANLGLLRQIEASREHLYFKGEQLINANHIVLTVEPIGGSEHPTSPDVFVFDLHGK
ncbi:anti-sigma factor [Paenibacillus xylaniclasticus]|uniref:anti-sigma factor n=1 Tax=Paenibacillus xylaniclasticus TaxID=588083 RepID=UPI000FDA14E4|nr:MULTISPECIES: anti-sigma factor [Paenibacillus]GFN33922.1 hypothetical protein PCURB6_41820 [Paenibacillus curdlanolyticus]